MLECGKMMREKQVNVLLSLLQIKFIKGSLNKKPSLNPTFQPLRILQSNVGFHVNINISLSIYSSLSGSRMVLLCKIINFIYTSPLSSRPDSFHQGLHVLVLTLSPSLSADKLKSLESEKLELMSKKRLS